MITTYRLHINDLTADLLDAIKSKFSGKEVEIIISDGIKEKESDHIRNYIADEDIFKFWLANEEDIYEDYKSLLTLNQARAYSSTVIRKLSARK